MIDIAAHGAVGDGATDRTDAIQAALGAATAGARAGRGGLRAEKHVDVAVAADGVRGAHGNGRILGHRPE